MSRPGLSGSSHTNKLNSARMARHSYHQNTLKFHVHELERDDCHGFHSSSVYVSGSGTQLISASCVHGGRGCCSSLLFRPVCKGFLPALVLPTELSGWRLFRIVTYFRTVSCLDRVDLSPRHEVFLSALVRFHVGSFALSNISTTASHVSASCLVFPSASKLAL